MPSYIIVILGTFAKNAFIQQTPTADIIVGANDAELDKLLKLWAAEQYKSEIKPPVSDVFATSVPTCKEVKLDVNGAVIVDTASTVDTINTATATDTFETVSGTIFIKFAENTSKRAEIVYRAGWWMKTDQTIAVVYKSDKPQYTQKDIDDLQLTITNLKNENETSKQETEYALDKTGNLLNTIATLEMQISSQKSLDATISGIEKVLDEMHESRKILSSDLLNSKQTNSELTDELNRANEQINTLVGMNQTMINRINENDEQIAELNDRIRDEQTKNTFIAQEIHAMYGDYIKQMKEKHNDIVSAFRDANASLQTRYEAQIHALNDKIAELKHSDVKPVKFTAIKQGSYDDVVEELKGFKLSSLRRVQKSDLRGPLAGQLRWRHDRTCRVG